MNNARPSAVVRPTRRWQKFRPAEVRRELDDRPHTGSGKPEDKGLRRTVTIVFRAS